VASRAEQISPGALEETGRRVAFLPAAVLGNGSLLATLSARGEVEHLFWPHVDGPQQLGELRLELGGGRALDEKPFTWEQVYDGDTSILRTVARDGAESVELVDAVDPVEPVLGRRVRGDGSVVVRCRPLLDEAEHFTAAYVDPDSGAAVFYRRRTALALVAEGPALVRSLAPGGHGRFDTLAHEPPVESRSEVRTELFLAFGASPDEALGRALHARREGFSELERRRRSHDAAVIGSAEPPIAAEALYRRSLLVLDMLADRATGGVIAAPELDPGFRRSGGYGFVWPRDLAFVVLALLAAGRRDRAAAALRWLVRTQAPEGLWLHRHWTDGSLAPSWGLHQADETGSVLLAYDAAWRGLGDPELDAELWPSACAAAEFLEGFVDEETGLLQPSVDLWETRDAQHAYSCAAAVAGLRAAAAAAERHDPALMDRFRRAAAGIAAAIERHLWSDDHGRYLRSRLLGRADGGGLPLPRQFERLRYPNRIVRSADPVDARLDAALLGLAWPFAAVDPGSPRMRATADMVEHVLTAPCGGLHRFEGDSYAGGNPWPLCTLWLGLHRRQTGDEAGFRRALDYLVSRSTPLGLLPEQVHPDGSPAWVLPLAWSHALLVLAARPELALG
jgi:glucoamylase